MWFVILLAIQIGLSFIAALLASKNKNRPNALGDFSFPTAEEGRAIPIVFGTVPLDGGNTVWWGDLLVKPIKQTTAFFLSTTIGYRYYLGVQYVLCQGPIDALIAIESDNKHVAFTPTGADPTVLTIAAPNLFGGDKSGGGLAGTINFYKGTQTQGSDAYLSQKQTAVPSTPVYSGMGNGYLAFLSAGAAAINETITIKAVTFDFTVQQMRFTVTGSVSGSMGSAWPTISFSNSKINFLITPGSIPFAVNDQFQVTTTPSRVSPNYHGICYAVLKQFYLGTSSYPHPIRFVVRRCPDPLGMGALYAQLNTLADGSADANPAFALYDLLTNPAYGLGISSTLIDATSFHNVATTLQTEGLGIATVVDQENTADSVISEILRHIDGTLYVEPTTGFWTLKLIRPDYDPTTIPVLTVDNVLDVPSFSRSQWNETVNQIFVQFLDRASDFQQRTVQNHDLANITVTNEVRAQTLEFKMLSNATTAALIATRSIKPLAYPLGKLKVTTNRIAWAWRQGGVFKFTWVPLGITGLVFRIGRIGYGQLTDGKITVEAVEDVFGIGATAFQAPPTSGWTNPTGAPLVPLLQRLLEAPYALVTTVSGLTLGIWVFALCVRQDATPTDFEVWQNFGAGDTQTADLPIFCPAGFLQATYPAATVARDMTGFSISANGGDLATLVSTDTTGLFNGENLAVIDDEIISWRLVTINSDGTRTISDVLRGVLDTVPADHAPGAPVYFFSNAEVPTQVTAYGGDLTVRAKFLPSNNLGTYPLGSAIENDLQTRSRYARPYPPGNLRILGNAYGTRPTTTALDLTFTWSSRNRLTQTSGVVMIPQDQTDIIGESGQTYKIVILIGGVVVRTLLGLTSTTYTYTQSQRFADNSDMTQLVTIEIYSNANGLDSMFFQSFSITMTAGVLTPGRYEFNNYTVGGLLI